MANNAFILLIQAANNEDERNRNRVNRRQLRDRSDPLSMPEEQFKGIYRLSRQLAHDLILDLDPFLPDNYRDGLYIPKMLKVLVALHFFAQGGYQKSVGQDYFVPMSQSSVSRCISAVNTALESLYFKIKFPVNEEECSRIKQGFLTMRNGFPGIIGAIDGTQISICAPIHHEDFPQLIFYNRKGYYSINVQIICDSNCQILAINARFPGSVHDAAIWRTSQIRQLLENHYRAGDTSSWLIGDSGYPLEPWLMTPVNNQLITPGEENYNSAHRSCRNVIERTIGILKGRFRCLLKHRVLHYSPPVVSKIIYSCAVLHNICNERREENLFIDFEEDRLNNNEHEPEPPNLIFNNNAATVRNRIIRTYFN